MLRGIVGLLNNPTRESFNNQAMRQVRASAVPRSGGPRSGEAAVPQCRRPRRSGTRQTGNPADRREFGDPGVRQSRNLAVPQSWSPAVLEPASPATRQPRNPGNLGVPQPRNPAVPQPSSPTNRCEGLLGVEPVVGSLKDRKSVV